MPPDERDQRVPPGEWTFKKNGQVFGPVAGAQLVQLLYRGEVDGRTPIAAEDGAYHPIAGVSGFLLHVKKAEAAQRVEREVTGARLLARRRKQRWGAAVGALSLAALVAGGYGAYVLAIRRPWEKRSALLEDFGGGIAVASAARVGGGRHAPAEDEVEVPLEVGPERLPRAGAPRGPAPAAPRPSASAEGGDLVAAQYDERLIQAVVAREQRTLAPCLRAAAEKTPDFAGEVPLEFAIGNDGKVDRLWIDEARFKHGELHDCLLRTLKSWSFQAFPGQRPTVSLSFRIGAR